MLFHIFITFVKITHMKSLSLRFFCLFSLVVLLAACQKQDSLSLSVNTVRGTAAGGSLSFEIKCSGSWQMSALPDFVQCEPRSGDGTKTITVHFQKNLFRTERSGSVTITFNTLSSVITLVQDANTSDNSPPSAPVLLSPQNDQDQIPIMSSFSWSPSVDENKDVISYYFCYSVNQQLSWEIVPCDQQTSFTPITPLFQGETTYCWKVIARDNYSGTTESAVSSFTTAVSTYRLEGEVRTLMENRPVNGVNLVFLCDGCIAEDLSIDGKYDQMAERALEYFFDIEPYKTYKDYFNAYLVYGFSNESGVSYGADNLLKNTAFSLMCDKDSRTSTHMSCDQNKVLTYALKTPITDLAQTLVIVIANDNRYAGTCWMWANGQAIALLTSKEEGYPYNFKGTLQHEAGGHGFAKLADEYINAATAATRNRNDISAQHLNGAYANVDITNDPATIYWKHFIGLPAYEHVGAYEGGYYFAAGVWRPESGSCMINNVAYYNAPSREAIVKRIMLIAKEPYSFEAFLAKDVAAVPAYLPPPPTKLQEHLYLHPPVWVK